MTEQLRDKLIEHAPAPLVDKALEAARTEGRQQAVCEIWDAARADRNLDELAWRALTPILDRVAGLNASESGQRGGQR